MYHVRWRLMSRKRGIMPCVVRPFASAHRPCINASAAAGRRKMQSAPVFLLLKSPMRELNIILLYLCIALLSIKALLNKIPKSWNSLYYELPEILRLNSSLSLIAVSCQPHKNSFRSSRASFSSGSFSRAMIFDSSIIS